MNPQALAVVLASQSDDKKEANLQLKAQLHYRLGDYGAAIKAYHEVFNQHKVRDALLAQKHANLSLLAWHWGDTYISHCSVL